MPKHYDMCFACGKDNPTGLKLDFTWENDEYVTIFIPREEHQSYPGIMHGGLTATILDETCARYIFAQGIVAYTADLKVRYRKGIPIGKPVRFSSRVVKDRGRLHELEAKAVLEDGSVAAEAWAKIMEEKKNREEES